MLDSQIKLSDWKALDSIQDAIELYCSGSSTDYDTLLKIKNILDDFGFIRHDE